MLNLLNFRGVYTENIGDLKPNFRIYKLEINDWSKKLDSLIKITDRFDSNVQN